MVKNLRTSFMYGPLSNFKWRVLNRPQKYTYFRRMICPLIYQYFTKMAFLGSTISRGIFSDYPRALNLQAAETSWLYPTIVN